jgi:lipid-A-disaccharide synthase-like uncharacterized protein
VSAWRVVGGLGALLFAARWLVQIRAARRAGAPVVTPLFWLISLAGSVLLVCYFGLGPTHDPIGVLGNALPLCTALFNLRLVARRRA